MRGFHNQPWLLRVLSRAREKKVYLVLKQDDAWALRQQQKNKLSAFKDRLQNKTFL